MMNKDYRLIGSLMIVRKDDVDIFKTFRVWLEKYNIWMSVLDIDDKPYACLKIINIDTYILHYIYSCIPKELIYPTREIFISLYDVYRFGRRVYTNLIIQGEFDKIYKIVENIRKLDIFVSTRRQNETYYKMISKYIMS